jgi:hypothetical protein
LENKRRNNIGQFSNRTKYRILGGEDKILYTWHLAGEQSPVRTPKCSINDHGVAATSS